MGDKLFATFWGISSHSISLFHLLPLLEQTIRGEVYFYILCLCCGANGPEHVEMGQRRPLRHSDLLPVGNTIQTLQCCGHHTACPFLVWPPVWKYCWFPNGGPKTFTLIMQRPAWTPTHALHQCENFIWIDWFIIYLFWKLMKHFKSYSPFGLTWF